MSIIVTCPSCGSRNRIPDHAEGRPLCGRCKTALPAPPARPIELTDAGFAAFLQAADTLALVDFWAPWCGPCRAMAPVLEKFAAMHPQIRTAKLDIDANPRTTTRFAVSAVPTLILFQGQGEVRRWSGAMSLPELLRQLQPWL